MSSRLPHNPADGESNTARLTIAASDQLLPDADEACAAGDQAVSDADQARADGDQAVSDADQASADSDAASADSDHEAADSDREASDRDIASGLDPAAHEFTRDIRRRAARQREQTARRREQSAQARLASAEKRDAIAHARDLAAQARDLAADAREQAIARREAADEQDGSMHAITGAELVMRAADQRRRAAEYRARSAEQRALAARDRAVAAADREQAARDRRRALADREALARQLAIAETDALTGARTRAAGLTDLGHELDRCRRTGSRLVVVYLDVVGLKRVNDSDGHGAGDELLKRVVSLIKEHVRPYDLVIRLGGDEFLCALPSMTMLNARERFGAIAAALAAAPPARAIRTGFAELTADESVTDLIALADRQLLDSATSRRDGEVMHDPRAVRSDGARHAGGAALSFTLRGEALAPRRARAALVALAGDMDPEQLALAEMVITELVTNSVVHGGSTGADEITVQVAVRGDTVHGEVRDSGAGFTPAEHPESREIGGLGLVIVDRGARRWGSSHAGRRVWFELDRGAPDSPGELAVEASANGNRPAMEPT